jgi:hypothetical protein
MTPGVYRQGAAMVLTAALRQTTHMPIATKSMQAVATAQEAARSILSASVKGPGHKERRNG